MREGLFFILKKAIKRSIMILSDFWGKCHYYSCYYGFWSLVWWLGNYCSKLFSWKKKADIKKKDWLSRYIERNYTDIIQHYKDDTVRNQTAVRSYRIWVFWAQGEEYMPDLVKCCYKNLLRQTQDSEVILLTTANLKQYLNLPDSVFNSLDKQKIGYTHLSDIIRNSLLAQYGGLWIDATVWITSDLPISTLKKLSFFSPKASKFNSFWVSYLLGTNKENSILFSFVRDMLIALCERETYWPDYLVQDFLIGYAFNNLPSVRETMISCPDNNPRRSDLWIRMNKVFDADEYKMLAKDNWMFKLSYKSHLKVSINGRMTYYGTMISGNL